MARPKVDPLQSKVDCYLCCCGDSFSKLSHSYLDFRYFDMWVRVYSIIQCYHQHVYNNS